MKKKILFVLLIFAVSLLKSQSISQIGFIIKKSIPGIKEIIILTPEKQKTQVIKQTKMAQVITRLKYNVYSIKKTIDVIKKVRLISKKKNIAVYILTDEKFFKEETIQTISDKLIEKQISIFTNRIKDTMIGALMTIHKKNEILEKHVNLITASILKITIPAEFLKDCIIDVE